MLGADVVVYDMSIFYYWPYICCVDIFEAMPWIFTLYLPYKTYPTGTLTHNIVNMSAEVEL